MWVVSHAEKVSSPEVSERVSVERHVCEDGPAQVLALLINVYLKQNLPSNSWFSCSAGEMKLHGLSCVWSNSESPINRKRMFSQSHAENMQTPHRRKTGAQKLPAETGTTAPASWPAGTFIPNIFAHMLVSWGEQYCKVITGQVDYLNIMQRTSPKAAGI